MKYTVVWKRQTVDQLAEIWMKSNNGDGVSAATLEVDRALQSDADERAQIQNELQLAEQMRH